MSTQGGYWSRIEYLGIKTYFNGSDDCSGESWLNSENPTALFRFVSYNCPIVETSPQNYYYNHLDPRYGEVTLQESDVCYHGMWPGSSIKIFSSDIASTGVIVCFDCATGELIDCP